MTSAPPVAHPGIEAKIGAKKTDTKKASPVTMAVIPVLPPSVVKWWSGLYNLHGSGKHTRNTSSTFNIGSDGAGSHQSTNADTERIDTVGHSRVFKVQGDLVAQASETRHRVESTGCIQDINIEECHQGVPDVAIGIVVLEMP